MKHCPQCKTTYTDDSLKFCLADGAALFSISEREDPTLVSPNKNPIRVDIPPNTAPDAFRSAATTANQPETKRSIIPFVVGALVVLILLTFIGVGALVMLYPFGKNDVAQISNNSNPAINSSNSRTIALDPSNSANTQNELQEKLANLERRLEEQKKQQKTSANTSPFPTEKTTPENNPGMPTARVARTNDGFLSLRTEPSVKTGTQLVKIPSGATINLENCERDYVTVDGRRGRWCMVTYNGETGWVFDAFLIY